MNATRGWFTIISVKSFFCFNQKSRIHYFRIFTQYLHMSICWWSYVNSLYCIFWRPSTFTAVCHLRPGVENYLCGFSWEWGIWPGPGLCPRWPSTGRETHVRFSGEQMSQWFNTNKPGNVDNINYCMPDFKMKTSTSYSCFCFFFAFSGWGAWYRFNSREWCCRSDCSFNNLHISRTGVHTCWVLREQWIHRSWTTGKPPSETRLCKGNGHIKKHKNVLMLSLHFFTVSFIIAFS